MSYYAELHGYIVTANADGGVPLNSKIVAIVDGDPAARGKLIAQANVHHELVAALRRIADEEPNSRPEATHIARIALSKVAP